MTNSTVANLIDDHVGDLEQAICDVLGQTIDSDISTVPVVLASTLAQPNGVATLGATSLVVQNPANATATPAASKIVMSDGASKIAAGWVPTTVESYGNARLRLSGSVTQTVAAGVSANLTLPSTEGEDAGGWHSGGTITLPSAGLYLVSLQVYGTGTTNDTAFLAISPPQFPLTGVGLVVTGAGLVIQAGGMIYVNGSMAITPFTFLNNGSGAMSITDVYLSIAKVT
jgi:hypothetical protein